MIGMVLSAVIAAAPLMHTMSCKFDLGGGARPATLVFKVRGDLTDIDVGRVEVIDRDGALGKNTLSRALSGKTEDGRLRLSFLFGDSTSGVFFTLADFGKPGQMGAAGGLMNESNAKFFADCDVSETSLEKNESFGQGR